MDREEWIAWFVVMLPLIMSPGPANLAIASVSASQGFHPTLRFAAGVSLVNCLSVALIGFGMGALYVQYRGFFRVLEVIGALYIMYTQTSSRFGI